MCQLGNAVTRMTIPSAMSTSGAAKPAPGSRHSPAASMSPAWPPGRIFDRNGAVQQLPPSAPTSQRLVTDGKGHPALAGQASVA